LLNVICSKLRLLRAVCYRPLFLSEVTQNLLYSTTYLKVEIIDVTHRILKLVRSRWVGEEVKEDVKLFHLHVHQWIILLIKRIEPRLIQDIYVQSKSKFPDLFGSKVIDLLECILDCEKDITVNTDSGGWCYMKGEYKLYGMYPSEILCWTFVRKPLTLDQQSEFQLMLWKLASSRNESHLQMLKNYEVSDDFRGGLYELNRLLCHKDVSYQNRYYFAYRAASYIIIKVDLKCRKELAPVELLELLKEQSYEDIEEEDAPGAHTVPDSSPDLELQIEIEEGRPWFRRRDSLCKFLIRQKHTDS
jgi:hypothetical protein